MLLSKSCIYGLRSSLFLATRQREEYVSIKQMSSNLGISFHFLTKILQQLTAVELMESYKGPNGGVRLSERGWKASIFDVVVAIDGPNLFRECVLGLEGCGTDTPCPFHEKWGTTRSQIEELFQATLLASMAKDGQANRLRISNDGSFKWK